MKFFKRIVKILLYIALFIFAGLLVLLVYSTITKYRPQEKELLYSNNYPDILQEDAALSLMTWNIGYAGLGNDMDFFYDGGRQMRTTFERTLKNHSFIIDYLDKNRHKDFILLQEVDKKARRSYNINTFDSLKQIKPGHYLNYGKNYDVGFIPLPIYNPMGHVNSGLVTISKKNPFIVERHSYPGSYPFPNDLFNLQRCFTLNRYPVENGRELVIINTHNSAFDDGELRKKQKDHLRNVLMQEYRKGNYVIAGGDFNQCPPGFEHDFHFNYFDTLDVMYINDDFLPDWQYAYDKHVPTNRRLTKPYDPSKTLTTLIDFFIVSPNIKILYVENIHLNFKYSDHNPVKLKVMLLDDKKIEHLKYLNK